MTTYSSYTLPAWISFNSATGQVTGTTPDITANTTYAFAIDATSTDWSVTKQKVIYINVQVPTPTPVVPTSTPVVPTPTPVIPEPTTSIPAPTPTSSENMTTSEYEVIGVKVTVRETVATTRTATGVGTGSAISIAATSSSGSSMMWAMVNQNQLLVLFLLINTFIVVDIREHLKGQAFALFNFNFIPVIELEFMQPVVDWLGEKQKQVGLDSLDFNSTSTINNLAMVTLLFILCAILHSLVTLSPTGVNSVQGEPGKFRKLWIKGRTHLLSMFKYMIYIRLLLEVHESLLISSSSEIYYDENEAPGRDVSFGVAIFIFWISTLFLVVSIVSYIK